MATVEEREAVDDLRDKKDDDDEEENAVAWCEVPCLDHCQQARLEAIRQAMLREPKLWEDFRRHTGHAQDGACSEKPVAFRTLDWFVTNFSRGRRVTCRGKDVYAEYKTRLRCFHKDFFDPFRRGKKIRFHPEGDDRPDAVVTALCQLNFFMWAIESGVVEECARMAAEIEKERREANRLKRKRQVEALKLHGVVEVLAHGVGLAWMLVEEVEPQLVRPPVPVRRAASGSLKGSPARHRALALVTHGLLSFRRGWVEGLCLRPEPCGGFLPMGGVGPVSPRQSRHRP